VDCRLWNGDWGLGAGAGSREPVLSELSGRRSEVSGPWSLFAAFCFLLLALAASAADPKFSDVSLSPRSATNMAQSSASTITTAPLPTAMDALDDKYHLAIGDRLSYRIVEDEEDPKPLFVTDSGDLEIPLLGRVPAVGRTCKELARALKADLEKEYYYNATVIVAVDVMTRTRGKVYLFGAVRVPGPQEIPSDETFTVSKAILRAGGFTDFADKRKVKSQEKAPPREHRNRPLLSMSRKSWKRAAAMPTSRWSRAISFPSPKAFSASDHEQRPSRIDQAKLPAPCSSPQDYQIMAPMDGEPGQESPIPLRKLLRGLVKFWWIPLITLALGLGAAALAIKVADPVFSSRARLWETVKPRLPESGMFTEDAQNFIGTQTELLQSGRLRALALERLRNTTNVFLWPAEAMANLCRLI